MKPIKSERSEGICLHLQPAIWVRFAFTGNLKPESGVQRNHGGKRLIDVKFPLLQREGVNFCRYEQGSKHLTLQGVCRIGVALDQSDREMTIP